MGGAALFPDAVADGEARGRDRGDEPCGHEAGRCDGGDQGTARDRRGGQRAAAAASHGPPPGSRPGAHRWSRWRYDRGVVGDPRAHAGRDGGISRRRRGGRRRRERRCPAGPAGAHRRAPVPTGPFPDSHIRGSPQRRRTDPPGWYADTAADRREVAPTCWRVDGRAARPGSVPPTGRAAHPTIKTGPAAEAARAVARAAVACSHARAVALAAAAANAGANIRTDAGTVSRLRAPRRARRAPARDLRRPAGRWSARRAPTGGPARAAEGRRGRR